MLVLASWAVHHASRVLSAVVPGAVRCVTLRYLRCVRRYSNDPPSAAQLQYASRNEGTEEFIPGLNTNTRVYTHDTNLLRNMLGAVDLDGNGELSLNEIIEYFASNTMQKNQVSA